MKRKAKWESEVDLLLKNQHDEHLDLHVDVVDKVMDSIADHKSRVVDGKSNIIAMNRRTRILAAACFLGVVVVGVYYFGSGMQTAKAESIELCSQVSDIYSYCFDYGSSSMDDGQSYQQNPVYNII